MVGWVLFPGAGYHELYNGVVCNDTILATGVFSSKELWMLSKGTTVRHPLSLFLSFSLSIHSYIILHADSLVSFFESRDLWDIESHRSPRETTRGKKMSVQLESRDRGLTDAFER